MEIQNYQNQWHITYHFVWGPMRAKACLTEEIAHRLTVLIHEEVCTYEFKPVALIVLPDRVYLAAEAPPTLAPHSIICQVKAYTSRVLRAEFPELTRIPSLWTRTYLVMAGDGLAADDILQQFTLLLPDKRPRGRPRKSVEMTDLDTDDNE